MKHTAHFNEMEAVFKMSHKKWPRLNYTGHKTYTIKATPIQFEATIHLNCLHSNWSNKFLKYIPKINEHTQNNLFSVIFGGYII
jgi:hypothetical protein